MVALVVGWSLAGTAAAEPVKLSTTSLLSAKPPASVTLDGFSQVRQEVMGLIGMASRRIWLSADYLTDGDVVSGLYLAQYRKLNVQVLLGKKKANAYMSRLGFLKNQNIPVFLRPESFVTAPTAILVDDRLLTIDGDLDFRANYRKFTVTLASVADAQAFEAGFSKAANVGIPARAEPVPLVGRDSGGRSPSYRGATSSASASSDDDGSTRGQAVRMGKRYRPPMGSAKYSKDELEGSFDYSYRDKKAPDGVPRKLPKEPLYQKLEVERQRMVTSPEMKEPKDEKLGDGLAGPRPSPEPETDSQEESTP